MMAPAISKNKKKILLTGGRSPTALFLARKFHKEGHEVFVAETSRFHICRYSNAVKKSFVIPSPRFNTKGFIDELVTIINEEGIDLYLPTYEEILYFSQSLDRFPPHCSVYIPPFETLNNLHNKWLFYCKLMEMDIDVPKTVLIRSEDDLKGIKFTHPYVLKPTYSRASQKVQKIDPNETAPKIDIEPHNPWVAQEYLSGKKYCTYSLCHEGKVRAHCVYPIEFSVEGNSCLVHAAVEHKEINEWVERFVKREKFTGQIAFDFIETDDGKLYPIECNPRATSGLYLFDQAPNFHEMFFTEDDSLRITPPVGMSRQFRIGMVLYGWRAAYEEKKLLPYFKTLVSVPDVIFCRKDIMPFLSMPIILTSYWLNCLKWHLRIPSAFTFDTDWDNEEARSL